MSDSAHFSHMETTQQRDVSDVSCHTLFWSKLISVLHILLSIYTVPMNFGVQVDATAYFGSVETTDALGTVVFPIRICMLPTQGKKIIIMSYYV